MKVWILTYEYLPYTGGLVSYAYNLSKYLKTNNIKVEIVVTNSRNSALAQEEVVDGVKVRRINISYRNIVQKIFSPIVTMRKISKYMDSLELGENDIVVSRYFLLAAAMCKRNIKHAFILPIITGKQQKIIARNKKMSFRILSGITSFSNNCIENYAVKHADKLVVLSESKKEELISYFKLKRDDIAVIPPGVDMERFHIPTIEEKNMLRQKNDIPLDAHVVVCVSRLSNEKNLLSLIEAFRLLDDDKKLLLLVGGGEIDMMRKAVIDREVDNSVILCGEQKCVEEYYMLSDAFAMISRYEGFGHVYIEAMSCGLQCVASKNNPPECITASDEIIINDKLGRLVKYNDIQEISLAIQDCLMNSNTSASEYSRSYVADKYSWNAHYKNITNLW